MYAKSKHLTLRSGGRLSPSNPACTAFSHSLDFEKPVDVSDQRTGWEINKKLANENTCYIYGENEGNADERHTEYSNCPST